MKNHHTQCDSCLFKIIEDQANLEDDKSVEQKYSILRDLKCAPKRAISVSFGVPRSEKTDKTETCILQSPIYPSKVKSEACPERIDSASGLTLEAALSLKHSSAANRLAEEANSTASKALDIAEREASSARSSARYALIAAIIATTALIITNIEQIVSFIGPWLMKI
jgi:hypothetical protein